MNTEKAIKEINSRIELANRQHYADLVPEYIEALEQAAEALRKQEPMKLTYDHRYGETGCAFCGNMGSGLEELPNYCPQCGQAIDWEDGE